MSLAVERPLARRGCARTICAACGDEMIHRDHRRPWESSSAFGQFVHRLPHTFTSGDIDHYVALWLPSMSRRESVLLRLIEHKEPQSTLGRLQQLVLETLAVLIRHALSCETVPIKLDGRSGVFLMRGPVDVESDGPRAVRLGPQTVNDLVTGRAFRLDDEADISAWIQGKQDR